MKILIIYATNSGGTYLASQIIAETLIGLNHQVIVKNATEADHHELASYDLVIIGSNTWNFSKEEGLPHEDIRKFLNKIAYSNLSLENKKFAVFALGDSSYMYFCGSADVLETFLAEKKANLPVSSLRVDGFFFHQVENTEKVKKWAGELSRKLA